MNNGFHRIEKENPLLASQLLYSPPEDSFDCSRFVPHKCKALCCVSCPIEDEIWERNISKLVHHNFIVIRYDEKHIMPLTYDMRCPFSDVQDGYKCRIYGDRPSVCKAFGNGFLPCTSCPYMDRGGRKRNSHDRDTILARMSKELEQDISTANNIKRSMSNSLLP